MTNGHLRQPRFSTTLTDVTQVIGPKVIITGPGDKHRQISGELLDFFADRLKVHLREQGIRHDPLSAVFALGQEDNLVRLLARVSALKDFLDTEDGATLLTAYRRANKIVRFEENEENKDGVSYEGEAKPTLLTETDETAPHQRLTAEHI